MPCVTVFSVNVPNGWNARAESFDTYDRADESTLTDTSVRTYDGKHMMGNKLKENKTLLWLNLLKVPTKAVI